MNAYLGTVSNVDADARRVQVSLAHLRTLTRPLRCVSPFGVLLALPAVGDEVLIVCTGPSLADAVAVGWLPTSADFAAASGPLVFSTSGNVPRQTDPDQEIADAAVSSILAR